MSLKNLAIRILPARYLLPLRYYARRIRGTLEREMSLLPRLVEPGRVALDVGANVGLYSYALAKLGASVEAFEPVPWCAASIESFRSPRIRVHRIALSSRAGFSELHIPLARGRLWPSRASLGTTQHAGSVLRVPVATLDSFGFAGVSFVKIDVEGHELEVLRGAVETLSRESPNLLVEVEQARLPYLMEEVFAFLRQLGYRGFFLLGARLRPLSEFSLREHQRRFSDGEPAPGFVCNFVFSQRRLAG